MADDGTYCKLKKDLSSHYLNEKFSDVVFKIEGRRFHAHKFLLAARSEYFEGLLYGNFREPKEVRKPTSSLRLCVEEVELQVDEAAFETLLKYIYTDDIIVTPSNVSESLDVLILANKYLMMDLQSMLNKKLESVMTLNNVCQMLNVATANDFSFLDLKNSCLKKIEDESLQFLQEQDTIINELTHASICSIFSRDTFYAPEIEIFNTVFAWSQMHKDNSVFQSDLIRLSLIPAKNLVMEVWDSGTFPEKLLLAAIRKQLLELEEIRRARRYYDKNFVSADQAEIISNPESQLLTNQPNYYEKVRLNSSLIVKLNIPTWINCIRISLSKEMSSFYFYVEVSDDQQTWKRIIDYSQFCCRSEQTLYFDPLIAIFIKVVPTTGSHDVISVRSIQASYKSAAPLFENGILRPEFDNIATVANGATVLTHPHSQLLRRDSTDVSLRNNYTSHNLVQLGFPQTAQCITIQLNQPYLLSSLLLLLWDLENAGYGYYIQTSVDNRNWSILADFRNDVRRSYQLIHFSERPVVFIKITGTSSAHDNWEFRCFHFECPAVNIAGVPLENNVDLRPQN